VIRGSQVFRCALGWQETSEAPELWTTTNFIAKDRAVLMASQRNPADPHSVFTPVREAIETADRHVSIPNYFCSGGDLLRNTSAVAMASKMTMRWSSLFHAFRFGGSLQESSGNHPAMTSAIWCFEACPCGSKK
jgi:hypothetical protein